MSTTASLPATIEMTSVAAAFLRALVEIDAAAHEAIMTHLCTDGAYGRDPAETVYDVHDVLDAAWWLDADYEAAFLACVRDTLKRDDATLLIAVKR